MTIKDVCKLTGLSQKCIRYYEEKGLLAVERETQNDYRDYTLNNIERLKLIKVLRYVDFSIEEILSIFETNNLSNALKEKSKQLENESNKYLEKQIICNSLLKDSKKEGFTKKIDDYNETLNFLESEDGKDFKTSFLESLSPSISHVIMGSIIFSAPILSLFLNIYMKKWNALVLNSIFAIICSMLIAGSWISYFNFRNKHKETVKNINKKNVLAIPMFIIISIIGLILLIIISFIVEKFMAPDNYLFYEIPAVVIRFVICVVVGILIVFLGTILRKLKIDKAENLDVYVDAAEKYKVIFIIAFLVIVYIFLTSISFVTSDEIIYHSPLHPFGIHYKYSDVYKVETGFGTKDFAITDYNRKGGFYYRIYFDGKKITFSTPIVNSKIEKYKFDTFLELEEFDNKLMEYDVEKIGDDRYAKDLYYDQRYVDRFLRIINNK